MYLKNCRKCNRKLKREIYADENNRNLQFTDWIYKTLCRMDWFKGNMDKWADKKLIAFCVGGSPIDNPEIDIALKRNFSESEQKKVKTFYCPGGFNYEKMSTPSKMMMKMFVKALKAKKDKTEAEEIMVKMISSSYDISNKKYIEPILQYLKK